MLPHLASVNPKSPIFHPFAGYSRAHFGQRTQISLNPIQISGSKPCSSNSFNFSNGTWSKDLGPSRMGFSQLGCDGLRVLAVSDGGGGLGGFGDGNSGGRGEGGGGASPHSDGNDWSFFSWYMSLLAAHPMLTKAVTSALLLFMGDLICQLLIDQVPSPDLRRTLIFSLLGMVMVGPTLHIWYLYLNKVVTLSGASGAFLRLLLDQFIFSPIFIGVFMPTMVTLEGKPSQAIPKLQKEWLPVVITNWQFWLPLQFLNFRFVPQQFQVLGANVITLVWNVIFSFITHKKVLPAK